MAYAEIVAAHLKVDVKALTPLQRALLAADLAEFANTDTRPFIR